VQAFLLVERDSFRQLLHFCRPELADKDIPKRKTVRSEVIQRTHLAKEKICEKLLVRVRLIHFPIGH
jgi:hypothetical protein